MSQILRLEYACTNAEMEQAQSLVLQKQLGGGSKWRARLVLLVLLVGTLLGFYFRFPEIPATYRALIIVAVLACSVLYVFYKRMFRKTDPAPIKVEISEMNFSILAPASKVTVPWSAFSQCLESPDLFVLLDRPKRTLVVVPKRAFPNESSQTWFREQATNGVTTPQSCEAPILAPFTAADKVTFTVHLRFRNYLDRALASWLTWGFVLVVGGLMTGMTLYSAAHPPPDAVNSSTKVFFMFVLPAFLVS
jgi:YcxB-like protein